MRSLFNLLFLFIVHISFAQELVLLAPKHILYNRIYNNVYLNCSKESMENLSFKCKDSTVHLHINRGLDNAFLIKPQISVWKHYNEQSSKSITLILIDTLKGKCNDSIQLTIKELPSPFYELKGLRSWGEIHSIRDRLDSVTIKSDLFDELKLNVKVESFKITAKAKTPKDKLNKETILFEKINSSHLLSTEFKEKFKLFPNETNIYFTDFILNIDGEIFVFDKNNVLYKFH